MIKPEELRIGNYIKPKNNEVTNFHTVVLGILTEHVYVPYEGRSEAFPLDKFEPVRLTEQWLIDFKFERTYFGRKLDNFELVASSRIVKTDELSGFTLTIIPNKNI